MALGAMLAFAAPLRAENRSCSGPDLTGLQPVEVGRIRGSATRVNLIRGGDKAAQCPDASLSCQERAYLVPGDLVVLGGKLNNFVCADYPNAKNVRAGWLPDGAIEPVAFETSPGAFAGKWSRVEATIEIAFKDGVLRAVGEATWGAFDPDRVKRGSVNVGNFDGALAFHDGVALFSEAAGANEPDPYSCHVRLTMADKVLIVQDNNQCGGANVSFTGYYFRAPK